MAAITILTLWSLSCHPTQWPGVKQLSKREEQRVTRETEEAIKKSPSLQELDRLCFIELPRPQTFVLVSKSRSVRGEDFLVYGYHSEADYQSVKNFYTNHFNKQGWQLSSQKEGGWEPPQIQFRNDRYKVTISDSGYRDEGVTYFVNCGELPKGVPPTP